MKINTATKITIIRVILIPVILLVLFLDKSNSNINILGFKVYQPYFIALLIYIVASLSDALDGYIARSTNTITNLGKFLDPVADKLLVNSLLIYFCSTLHLPALVVIIMIARDVIVDALRLLSIENNVVIAASIWGKIKTILQMISIGLIFIFAQPNHELPQPLLYLVYLATFASIMSGVDYFVKNARNIFN